MSFFFDSKANIKGERGDYLRFGPIFQPQRNSRRKQKIKPGQTLRLLSFRMRPSSVTGNRPSCKCNLLMGLQLSRRPLRGFRPKASSPDRLSRPAKKRAPTSFSFIMTQSFLGEGKGKRGLKSKEIADIKCRCSATSQIGPCCLINGHSSRALTLANDWAVRSLASMFPSA